MVAHSIAHRVTSIGGGVRESNPPGRVVSAASMLKIVGATRRPPASMEKFMSRLESKSDRLRLTQWGHGGGCACKIPPGELDELVSALSGKVTPAVDPAGPLLVGLSAGGDDAAVVGLDADRAVVTTADFFTPVVDDPFDWGRIAAANALSDVYAMGGVPLAAVNLLGWPRERLPMSMAAEVLRGGAEVAHSAGCHVAGGHSVDDPEPKYGMSVVGLVDPARMIRVEAGRVGLPLTLTKPLGVGVLNARHKQTGVVFPQAVEGMATLNREASVAAVSVGIRAGTDVTGFGLLGHLYKMVRAGGMSAVVDHAAVPYLDGARSAAEAGFVSGGTRRNLEWVSPHVDFGSVKEVDRLLLADAQTSGGLLLAGEVPGYPVIGQLVAPTERAIMVR